MSRLGLISLRCRLGGFLADELAISTAWLSLPTGLEELAHLKAWERVGFRIKHDLSKRQHIIRTEEEVEVLERLGLSQMMLAFL